ncbi:MAG: iron dicitrate transport regulator FecR, partial [Nitrospinaceae bacterium]|nr:iron dicitrate transport regulator FecR [Nitrospinaceae bacterium]NIR54981.1 iron dicitrate transport regulator FecR [Nitrospinaceae bacterium]NIS85395.1 iron dicitrate transport regulator FecR [Nitrospinaceae bacterium]NIT82221.1 iron dicitrate transport regulator FecR [Nitrospinaceae bacterium]NIU44465.1 iron dicitrate transport regulator FecR [Nitrospinaceae bacterium]
FPKCRHCSGLARPHILMFGDWEYTGHPEQEENFNRFLQKPVDLVLLVGSSGTIPTNDFIALRWKDQGTPVININPDPSANAIVHT